MNEYKSIEVMNNVQRRRGQDSKACSQIRCQSRKPPAVAKHELAIVSIDDGTQIDWRDEQYLSADRPRCETFQPESNVKLEKSSQCEKNNIEIFPIDEGI
jgi:hypothetical protein